MKKLFRNDKGFAMIEALAALVVMAVGSGAYMAMNGNTEQQKIRVTAVSQQMKTVAEAASQYAQANASTILSYLNSHPSGESVSIGTLESAGFLPLGFVPVTPAPWSQNIQVSYFEPAPGAIAAVVSTTGGNAMDDRDMVLAAKLQGSQGGYVPSSVLQSTYASQGICQGSCVQGAGNAWKFPLSQIPVPGAAPGRLVTYASLNRSSLVQNTLYRTSIPGNPAANTMQASINMNGNTISGLPLIGAGSCNAAGAIGVYNNAVVVCEGGQWQTQSSGSQWGSIKAPVPQTQYTNGGGLNTGGGQIQVPNGNISSGSLNTWQIFSGPINTNGQPINGGAYNSGGASFNPWNNGAILSRTGWHTIGQPYYYYGGSETPIGIATNNGPLCTYFAKTYGCYNNNAGRICTTSYSFNMSICP